MWVHKAYTPEYMDQILEMTQEHYGSENDISNLEFLQHQYFGNYAGDALIDLAVDPEDGKLAGQYVVWPIRFSVFEKPSQAVISLNTLTREKYRGQGIFTKLAEGVYQRAADTGYAFCCGMPNPNSYPGFMKKLSFRELGKMPLLLRPLKPSQMIQEFMHSSALGVVTRPVDLFFHIKCKSDKRIDVVSISKENVDLMDSFWEKVKCKYPVMSIRDKVFIRYRYLDMPRRTYFPYLAMQDGEPVCFAVGRIMEVAGMQCAMLADFMFVDGYETAAEKLLNQLLSEMKKQGAGLSGCLMLDHTQEYEFLKKHEFFRCPRKLEPQPFPLILRAFDKNLEEKGIYNAKNWFFTMGDYDVI